jgi:hypothetical protein
MLPLTLLKICFRRQFQRKMWQIQILFLLFIVWRMFLSYVILTFSHYRSNRYFPSSSSTTFQNSPGISSLLSEVSKFQYHIKLCFKCSTLLVSSLNLSLICWWKEPSTCWMLLLPRQSILKIMQYNVDSHRYSTFIAESSGSLAFGTSRFNSIYKSQLFRLLLS